MLSFKLSDDFVNSYKSRIPPFGYNGLGELVYRRTYSRKLPNGDDEDWYQTVRRVVEGTYTIQKNHIEGLCLGWKEDEGNKSAEEMYDRIYNMKFLPPGRGLWSMGTDIVHKKELSAALNNCAFVSTENIDIDLTKPFEFLMDASMLGVGVGFDTKGNGKLKIIGPDNNLPINKYIIPDSREGWVESVKLLLDSYFGIKGNKINKVIFDYSLIRPKGLLLKTFGGLSSGPDPLIDLHIKLDEILYNCINTYITTRNIVDICNLIGKCVVSGNVRRSAEIAFGNLNDNDFINLKNYDIYPERIDYGWSSNNSIFAEIGMDYNKILPNILKNGEPGLCWLDNMKNYSRMIDDIDKKDIRAKGGNPCLEQTLESYEMCCLVETFPFKHDTLNDYLRTLKFAYLYAKTVTLQMTHWPETNRVMLRNRRIGCSVSGIAQFLSKYNINILKEWLDNGYNTVQKWDEIYSNWFCIPKSIKTTSVKPSGTVSLLVGSTPGMHFPESKYYIRRVRISKTSPLLKSFNNCNYNIEDCVGDNNTCVISFPIFIGENVKTLKEVSMYEQLCLASFLQCYWADNQVSCTITFDPITEGNQIPHALDYFQYKLKGVSFLPKISHGAYPQMPYEEITKEQYDEMSKDLKQINYVDRNINYSNYYNNNKDNTINNSDNNLSNSDINYNINNNILNNNDDNNNNYNDGINSMSSSSSSSSDNNSDNSGSDSIFGSQRTTPQSVIFVRSNLPSIPFKVDLKKNKSKYVNFYNKNNNLLENSDSEEEEGVDFDIFPDTEKYCTNDHCI